MLVFDFKFTGSYINDCDFDILIAFFHRPDRRVWLSVGGKNAIAAKNRETIRIPEITTICPKILAIFGFGKDALIGKIPDEATNALWILFVQIEVFLKIAQRIPHGMGIFT